MMRLFRQKKRGSLVDGLLHKSQANQAWAAKDTLQQGGVNFELIPSATATEKDRKTASQADGN